MLTQGFDVTIDVSIPYERERIFRQERTRNRLRHGKWFQFPTNGNVSSDTRTSQAKLQPTASFNSLRTGTYLQTTLPRKDRRGVPPCFNSLRTGTYLQTKRRIPMKLTITMMFQFPTNGNVSSDTPEILRTRPDQTVFQFPTNGNVSSDKLRRRPIPYPFRVSIPYERERIFRPFSHLSKPY